jgi:hypothetical protein
MQFCWRIDTYDDGRFAQLVHDGRCSQLASEAADEPKVQGRRYFTAKFDNTWPT